MEDAHCAELDVDGQRSAFFGVYDGGAPLSEILLHAPAASVARGLHDCTLLFAGSCELPWLKMRTIHRSRCNADPRLVQGMLAQT